jgi:hypothetical protein
MRDNRPDGSDYTDIRPGYYTAVDPDKQWLGGSVSPRPEARFVHLGAQAVGFTAWRVVAGASQARLDHGGGWPGQSLRAPVCLASAISSNASL